MPRLHRAKEGDKIPIPDYNLKSDYLEALINMKVSGGTFKVDRAGASLSIGSEVQTEVRWAKLLANLPASTNEAIGDANPSTADAVLLLSQTRVEGELVPKDENLPITVVNRWTDFSAETDDVILIARVHVGTAMEWTPLHTSTSEETTDDGFPPGTGGCDCGNCFQGVTIPDADLVTGCCTSHLRFTLKNPWLSCEDTDLTLEYIGEDVWLTEVFFGPNCDDGGIVLQNEYRWKLEVDTTGITYLTLVLETDNGCDDVCVVYGRDSFNCQCDNQLSLLKPYGKWIGVERSDLSCYACVKAPETFPGDPGAVEECAPSGLIFPDHYLFNLTGSYTTDSPAFCTTNSPNNYCENLGGVYEVALKCSIEPNAESINCEDYSFEGYMGYDGFGGAPYHVAYTKEVINELGDTCFSNLPYNLVATLDIKRDTPGGPIGFIGFRLYATSGGFPATCGGAMYYLRGITLPVNQEELNDLLFNPITVTKEFEEQICAEAFPDEITLVPSNFTGQLLPPTSTGACADSSCATDPVPVDPDAGACCFQGTCFDYWEESLCADFGGTWHPDGDDCGTECEDHTACCVAGVCIIVSPYGCVNLVGGTLAGGSCDDDPCAVGACCSATDGICSLTSEEDCPSPNYWWGANTVCDPDPCPDLGACCESSAGGLLCGIGGGGATCLPCFLEEEGECGGQFAGAGTHCGTYTDCDCVGGQCDNGS